MTPMQIKMPDNLTAKNIKDIVFVISSMSDSTKCNFLASLLMTHPEHYGSITDAMGVTYSKCIPRA
jgi:hypothetical protein